jgi:hypothetical protein
MYQAPSTTASPGPFQSGSRTAPRRLKTVPATTGSTPINDDYEVRQPLCRSHRPSDSRMPPTAPGSASDLGGDAV